ncbi:hypothetical protein [Paenibacillus camerounensis]|uniref:hypothetical protein n=1 Tax=Paenibacillus camerounensis TaxID=1243663 RepID=UPI0005A7345F|nr:hypothetical protein [Paenibacillus camerounensis]
MINKAVRTAKAPAEILLLAAVSLNLGIWVYYCAGDHFANTVVAKAVIVLLAAVTMVLIYRIFTSRKKFDILLNDDSLVINNRMIPADTIKTIFVKGYFVPVIGIRPKGNLLVPYKYCFQYEDDKYIKELTQWAEQRQIKVAKKSFQRWL